MLRVAAAVHSKAGDKPRCGFVVLVGRVRAIRRMPLHHQSDVLDVEAARRVRAHNQRPAHVAQLRMRRPAGLTQKPLGFCHALFIRHAYTRAIETLVMIGPLMEPSRRTQASTQVESADDPLNCSVLPFATEMDPPSATAVNAPPL